jgi:hypothetical protein
MDGKLASVIHDTSLLGNGTAENPLALTSKVAVGWVISISKATEECEVHLYPEGKTVTALLFGEAVIGDTVQMIRLYFLLMTNSLRGLRCRLTIKFTSKYAALNRNFGFERERKMNSIRSLPITGNRIHTNTPLTLMKSF